MPTYQILAVTHLDSIHSTTAVIFETKRREAFDEYLERTQFNAVGLPKARLHGGGRQRAFMLVMVSDSTKAQEARRDGYLLDIPPAGTRWVSVKAASVHLGISAHSLHQALHEARRLNDGLDAPIETRGLRLAYASPGEGKAEG